MILITITKFILAVVACLIHHNPHTVRDLDHLIYDYKLYQINIVGIFHLALDAGITCFIPFFHV